MQSKSISAIMLVLFFTFQAYAQQFSGTVTNSNGDPVENAAVILQYPGGIAQNDTVYTDASGFYTIGETVVGIKNIAENAFETFFYRYDGNKLFVKITSKQKLTIGRLFGLDGKTLAEFPLHRTGNNTFTGEISLNNRQHKILIFSDMYFACKIPLIRGLSLSKHTA